MDTQAVQIGLEFTPNPNTLKFVVNRSFMERGAANFLEASRAEGSPLAKKLFAVPGVQGVMIGTNFVTITKSPTGNWDVVAEDVPKTIESHLKAGEPIFDASWSPDTAAAPSGDASDVEKKIREVLDNEIRPAVAMDGGDIAFERYEDGVAYLRMHGSCASCPSSVATLKMGVETRLREVVPELKEVVQV